MLARTLTDVYEEQSDFAAAAKWAERALAGMQGVVGVKVHPLLKAFFDAVAELKKKAGEGGGWRLRSGGEGGVVLCALGVGAWLMGGMRGWGHTRALCVPACGRCVAPRGLC